jgi:DNA-binding transcriptional ArsR family regulator
MARMTDAHPTKIVTDVRTLKAIAHPIRTRLLSLLRLDGPATATELARRTGESSGATSYHLRQLARYGYIEDEPARDGRERRWRAVSRTTTWEPADFVDDPEGLQVSDELERRQVRRVVGQFESWLARRSTADPAWLRAATLGDDTLRLTPSQARAFAREIGELRQRFLDAPPAAEPGEPVAFVAFYYQLVPFERLEELEV